DYEEVESGPEYDFFARNDIPLFVMQQLTDMVQLHNVWSALGFEKNGTKVGTVRHREAVFSRWSMMDSMGDIRFHYYAEWDKAGLSASDIICSRALDEFNTVQELKAYSGEKHRRRLIFGAYMPSPGNPYYSRPEWYSIFRSGWYDHSCMVPILKKAILKNQLGVKYIIYIAPEYFENIFEREAIDQNDRQAVEKRIAEEKEAIVKYLSGEGNANKAIMALKATIPSSSGGVVEQKYIEITTVQNDLKGGEYIDDTESTANIICYAMGVHSALIGATPGKNSNSLGGSNARELFMMKQALMKPVVDRCMRVLRVIKEYNQWDKDIMITIPEYIFTTLDQNKSGKEESNNNV
ncbi:MAG: hypothetical protein IKS71_02105, partial [Bacteroidales bacterium]|nr:hypothetical protein [Bacteroidales bacterium]